MKNILIVLILSFVLSGCYYQKADITDIKKATQFCNDKGGIKHIVINMMGEEHVSCVNGADESLMNVTLLIPTKEENE